MRFTTYSKYVAGLADAVNLQALLDQLGDFLLQSGFAGGDRGGARTRAAIAAGRAARGDPQGPDGLGPAHARDAPVRCAASPPATPAKDKDLEQKLAELLDQIVQRLIDEGS